MTEGIAEDREVVVPSSVNVADTNAAGFARDHGFESVDTLHERACTDLEWFWDVVVDELGVEFEEPYDEVRRGDNPAHSEWYVGGRLNLAATAVDKHARETPDATALVWEGEPGDTRTMSYGELRDASNRVANALGRIGIDTGDTVGLYMPRIPEAIPTLYGTLKRGAIVVPIFSGYGDRALEARLDDADCRALFTADGFHLGGKQVDLLANALSALESVPTLEDVIVTRRIGEGGLGRTDCWSWDSLVGDGSDVFDPVTVDADHPSMLLYTSGTTGKPKGTIQTHAGQVIKCAKDCYFDFDLGPGDLFFWVTDLGWVMGPWTLVGTHALGESVLLYEGGPTTPDPGRFWRLIEEHGVTVFGISPSGVRKLRDSGESHLAESDLSSLRLLGATGEPWDENSWWWFYEAVGDGELSIINVSGGTEMGGHFLSPLPGRPLKPCTVGRPSLGIAVDIVDETGTPIEEPGRRGNLVVTDSCPSMTPGLWNDGERYHEEYWSTWAGYWDHGDWVVRDREGFWYVLGRTDDVIKTAGRRVGAAEVESVLNEHEAVSDAAAVGVPDSQLGERLEVCVTLGDDTEIDDLRGELTGHIARNVGKPFRPADVHVLSALPKTQSGKTVRAVLAEHLAGDTPADTDVLQNGDVLDSL